MYYTNKISGNVVSIIHEFSHTLIYWGINVNTIYLYLYFGKSLELISISIGYIFLKFNFSGVI